MRCKNCGWDNPDKNVRCEKCNAPLADSIKVNRDLPEAEDSFPSDNYLKKTALGCPECGYPMKPSDKKCPQCGRILREASYNVPESKGASLPYRGTVIGGAAIGSEVSTPGRKKLVGFLVTYSPDANGLYFPLYEGRNIIGRDSASSICIPGDDQISGTHFSILYRPVDKKFKYRDEQSINGTFVNNQLSDEGELSDHDVIRIGSTQLITIVIPQ